MRAALVWSVIVCVSAGVASAATPVTGWRTDGTGKYPDAKAPTSWGPDKNVVWRTPMPNWSNATPVVIGEKVFVCAEPAVLICVSLKDGKVLWQKSFGVDQLIPPDQADQADAIMTEARAAMSKVNARKNELRQAQRQLRRRPNDAELKAKIAKLSADVKAAEAEMGPMKKYAVPATHKVNGHSSPTPVSDGKHVWVLSGMGTAACFDLDGNRKWIKDVEKPTNSWGHSASPVLADGKLIIHVLSVAALDAKTGEQAWKTPSKSCWGTPAVATISESKVVIIPNGDAIRASDGKKIATGLSRLEFAGPVIDGGVLYFPQAGGKALKLPPTAGESLTCESKWTTNPKKERYYGSAVVHDGLIYAITRYNDLSVIDAADGKIVYAKKLSTGGKSEAYPSISLIGGNVLVSSDNGYTAVIAPGREYKVVAENRLGEIFRSSPVAVGNRILIRGYKHLYCIGQ